MRRYKKKRVKLDGKKLEKLIEDVWKSRRSRQSGEKSEENENQSRKRMNDDLLDRLGTGNGAG